MSIDVELWTRIRNGDEPARQQVIEDTYPVVQRVARKMARGLPQHVDVGDLISYGTFGLLRAVQRYDPSKNVPFDTYVALSVRSTILDELRKNDWAPRSLRRRQREVNEAVDTLREVFGRSPSNAEVADVLGWQTEEVAQVFSKAEASYHKSLDEGDPDRDWSDAGDNPSDLAHSEVKGAQAAIHAVGVDHIMALPLASRVVLALRYFEGYTLARVGRELGIPESRASELHREAVLTIRSSLEEHLGSRVVF